MGLSLPYSLGETIVNGKKKPHNWEAFLITNYTTETRICGSIERFANSEVRRVQNLELFQFRESGLFQWRAEMAVRAINAIVTRATGILLCERLLKEDEPHIRNSEDNMAVVCVA